MATGLFKDSRGRRVRDWTGTSRSPAIDGWRHERPNPLRERLRQASVALLALGLIISLRSDGSAVVGIAAAGLLWLQFGRKRRPARLALWLRRFHQSSVKEIRLDTELRRALRGRAVPITLQDSTFRFSWSWALSDPSALASPILVAAGVYATIVFGVGHSFKRFGIGTSSQSLFDLVTLWVLALLIVALLIFALRRRLFSRIKREGAEEQVQEILCDIGRGTGRGTQLSIVRCDDDVWESVVEEFIECADFIIVDISTLTGSVLWELAKVSAACEPERVVLLHETAKIAHGVWEQLEATIGREYALQCNLLSYEPLRAPCHGNTTEAARSFRNQLTALLVKSQALDDPIGGLHREVAARAALRRRLRLRGNLLGALGLCGAFLLVQSAQIYQSAPGWEEWMRDPDTGRPIPPWEVFEATGTTLSLIAFAGCLYVLGRSSGIGRLAISGLIATHFAFCSWFLVERPVGVDDSPFLSAEEVDELVDKIWSRIEQSHEK